MWVPNFDASGSPLIGRFKGFGIKPHEVVQNFMAKNHENFAEDQELNPSAYAEQFSGPDATVAQAPEELLRRARMILSTELGKDPLLRNEMRARFKRDAEISVLPTDRGIQKIDEHHSYYVSILVAQVSTLVSVLF